MRYILGPETFGCAAKLTLQETRLLAQLPLSQGVSICVGDASLSLWSGVTVASIDRVGRCAADPAIFAEIALVHCERDVVAAGGDPGVVSIGFEFGSDAQDAKDRHAITSAFVAIAGRRSMKVGKCHSVQTAGATAVTIHVEGSKIAQSHPPASRGGVFMSGKLGGFKDHYLNELAGLKPNPKWLSQLSLTHRHKLTQLVSLSCDACDVTGHALSGTLASLALRGSYRIGVSLGSDDAFASRVLANEIACFDEPPDPHVQTREPKALALSSIRETAGPLICLVPDDQTSEVAALIKLLGGRKIGDFESGTPDVEIGWDR